MIFFLFIIILDCNKKKKPQRKQDCNLNTETNKPHFGRSPKKLRYTEILEELLSGETSMRFPHENRK